MLERIHARAQGRNPIAIEGFLNVLHFPLGRVGRGEVEAGRGRGGEGQRGLLLQLSL